MVTVPGIFSAQRFRTETPGFPPSLAIYSVASPTVFDDAYYLSVRGFREWQPLIDRRFYRRNLFDGLEHAPEVVADAYLLVADRNGPDAEIHGVEFVSLECVGIDRSTPYRGVAVLAAENPPPVDQEVAVYRPITPRFTDPS